MDRQGHRAPGEAKEGVWIICEIARRLGLGEVMAYDNPSRC